MSGTRTCHYYLQGNCKFGKSCRFSHSDGGEQRDYNDEYEPRNNRNADQQSYFSTNRNYKYGEREDYRNTNRYEKNNQKYDQYYEQDNHHYKYDSRNKNQYEANNYQYDSRSNNPYVKINYNKRNNYYEEENCYEEENNYEEGRDYTTNYNNYGKDNRHKNNHQPQKNYSVNNSKENYGQKNFNSQYNNKHLMNKNDEYNYQDQTVSNRYQKYSDNTYDQKQSNDGEKEKMQKLYKNEIKIYQMQMKQMLDNCYWPFTCFNPIGQSPVVEPVGCLNLMEISFEEIRCDYYSIKNICADPKMIHGQVYCELLLKAKDQKEDIVNLKDCVVDDLIATFQKWEQAKKTGVSKNTIPVDENVYWNMSVKRLKNETGSKSLLDSFSFAISDEVADTNDTGPKILMQTEVYGRMDNGYDEDSFIDYVPIIPPPEKFCH